MKKAIYSALALLATTTLAGAQAQAPRIQAANDGQPARIIRVHHETDSAKIEPAKILADIPAETWAASLWQKQTVYDLGNSKIGEVMDMVLSHDDGKPVALIIGVGGFLGVGEKDVAVPYEAVHFKKTDGKWQLIMNTTKDALKNAPGYKFDRTAQQWVHDGSATVGGTAPGAR